MDPFWEVDSDRLGAELKALGKRKQEISLILAKKKFVKAQTKYEEHSKTTLPKTGDKENQHINMTLRHSTRAALALEMQTALDRYRCAYVTRIVYHVLHEHEYTAYYDTTRNTLVTVICDDISSTAQLDRYLCEHTSKKDEDFLSESVKNSSFYKHVEEKTHEIHDRLLEIAARRKFVADDQGENCLNCDDVITDHVEFIDEDFNTHYMCSGKK